MTDYTLDRIKGLTETEAVYALCTQQITPDQIYAAWGYYPRTDSVIKQYEDYKKYCENPDLYWDERIDRAKRELETLESNKSMGILPPVPYRF